MPDIMRLEVRAVFSPMPIHLRGQYVELQPLAAHHLPQLFLLGREQSIWSFLSGAPFKVMADVEAWLQRALSYQAAGTDVPFAVVDAASGKVAGTTRYFDIRRKHRSLEIGATWYGELYRGTKINAETKLLLLGHAFGALDALRVQFQTDSRNLRSQRAIERLGAVREGVLRQHKICSDGYVRDSVVYSVTAVDWVYVKERIQALLSATHSSSVTHR